LMLKAGLTLYDTLAGFPGEPMRHHHHGHQEFSKHFPFLDESGLHGGFTYGDAQTDDARLVLEIIDGAMSHGAVCVNYCRMESLIEENGRAIGAIVQDRLGNTEKPSQQHRKKIFAKQIVNTTGYWMAEESGTRCRLTKGVHLVLPACGVNEALLLTAKSDGRVFFIIPWYGRTLIGTTDTDYKGNLENIAVETEDIAYLLGEANHYLNTGWNANDVIGSYAGLRTLKYSDVASPSAASRDWELKIAANGVHYSVGGKLTSAREDAATIVNSVCGRLGINVPCQTQGRPFPWKPVTTLEAQAQQLGIDKECIGWLIRRHGTRAEEIIHSIAGDPKLAYRIVQDLPFTYADLLFCAREEMVVHLDDLLRRRIPLLILAKLDKNELRRLAEMVAPIWGWDEATIVLEIENCKTKGC